MGCFAIVRGHPQMWRVFWASCSVGKLLKSSFNVAGHVQVDSAVLVVPMQVDATELFGFPVLGDGVLGLQWFHQVVSVFFRRSAMLIIHVLRSMIMRLCVLISNRHICSCTQEGISVPSLKSHCHSAFQCLIP